MSDEKTAEQIKEEILSALPERLKQVYLEQDKLQHQQMIRGAIAQVFHRNFSHNLGPIISNQPEPNKNGSS